ncbi:MAG: D-glycerate dehydrogenase [Chloroflexi bacterium]|nr:D-glycerate dehydrogenase [Chloroflexota bacterium]|tara:strand:+ start:45 stop:1004 length:960 start_codon:yes stop_codon:yes gene_type:complete
MNKIFVTRQLPNKKLINKLEEFFIVDVWEEEDPPSKSKLQERSKGCWGLLTMLTEKIDLDLISSNPSLKIIANMAVGYDNIDINAANKFSIQVTNTPDVLTRSTAELTIALIFVIAKRLQEGNAAIRNSEWGPWHPNWMIGKDLNNAKIGIIGPGKIGQEVAKIAKNLNMNVMYYGKSPKNGFPGEFVNLNKLLKNADFISVHLSLNEETKNFINMRHFTIMKKDAVLINTSRGKIINQIDLENAIKRKIIGGAALDVTDPEPLPATSELLKMQNVFISPHLGSATKKTRTDMAELAIKNLIEFNAGRIPPNAIDEEGV